MALDRDPRTRVVRARLGASHPIRVFADRSIDRDLSRFFFSFSLLFPFDGSFVRDQGLRVRTFEVFRSIRFFKSCGFDSSRESLRLNFRKFFFEELERFKFIIGIENLIFTLDRNLWISSWIVRGFCLLRFEKRKKIEEKYSRVAAKVVTVSDSRCHPPGKPIACTVV